MSDPLVGRVISHYRLTARLGAGGMGVVYRGVDERLGRDVALKFLPPGLHADKEARARLFQEARAAAALDHPHVASVYDVGETAEGRVFIVMGFYDGETLADRIAQAPLGVDESIDLTRQVVSGLGAAHRGGVIHRDVKPANVIVLPDGAPGGGPCVKILDFGIAKMDGVALTQAGQSVGTEVYMSPEQILSGPIDARTDVWGVGNLIHEMLSGQPAFGASYAAAITYNVLNGEPRPLDRDDVPEALEAILARCLAKRMEDRYPSMADLADALGRLGSEPESDPQGDPDAQPERTGSIPRTGLHPAAPLAPSNRWRRWAFAALAAVVAVAAAAVIWLAPQAEEAEHPRLAVLPFRAVGAETDQLSVGLVETLTSKLSQLGELRGRIRIVPASEISNSTTPGEARERLHATHVVEGVVQVENGRFRVSLNLIDVRPDPTEQLDAGQVDDASGSGFAIQDAAVVQVAEMLRAVGLLRVEVSIDGLADGGTDDPEANALYLRGRGALKNQQSLDDLARARSLFEDALALDPGFALAHAALADALWESYRSTLDLAWTDQAVASAQRALELDDGLAEVHIVLGTIYEGRGEPALAIAALGRALTLDPGNSEAFRRLGRVYAAQGRTAEAEAALKEAIALAPDVWRTHNSLGAFYLREGRSDEAEVVFRTALERDPVNLSLLYNLGLAAEQNGDPETAERAYAQIADLDAEHAQATAGLLRVRFYLGDYAGAAEAGARAVALIPDSYDLRAGLAEARWWAPGQRVQAHDDYQAALVLTRKHLALDRSPALLAVLANSFAAIGQQDSARVYLREIERSSDPTDVSVGAAYEVGVAYETIGESSRALVWLRSAFSRGFGRVQAERSPRLERLRSNPTFQSLLTSTTSP